MLVKILKTVTHSKIIILVGIIIGLPDSFYDKILHIMNLEYDTYIFVMNIYSSLEANQVYANVLLALHNTYTSYVIFVRVANKAHFSL